MPFKPGEITNPEGINGRPFERALKMEIAAAGEDHKALRAIARNLIRQAQKDELAALPSINTVADRLDGKVPQAVIGGGDDQPAIAHKHEVLVKIVD
jgi:hypothetical protein